MAGTTRRDVIAASGMALIAAPALGAAGPPQPSAAKSIAVDLNRYIGFGNKASGGDGDNGCGAWLEGELGDAGFTTERQMIDVPWFSPQQATLVVGDKTLPVLPQAIVVPTGPAGLSGPLVRLAPGIPLPADLHGALVLVDLPHARWSTINARPIRDTLDQAFAAGAAAAILITNGVTGDAILLNTPGDKSRWPKPVAIIAPNRAAPVLAAASQYPAQATRARLTITGTGGRRPAYNLVGRIDRGLARWLVMSTPRSGWTMCAGERGTGLAAWLSLARWAAGAVRNHNILVVCASGHEYEYLGAERFLHTLAPDPAATALWLHLGANVAARDWHDLGGGILLPLPSADPQRLAMASADLLPAARAAFAGLPGIEAPYAAGSGAAGELAGIVAAGYPRLFGIFGAHRFHHVGGDDARCVDPALIAPVITACRKLIRAA